MSFLKAMFGISTTQKALSSKSSRDACFGGGCFSKGVFLSFFSFQNTEKNLVCGVVVWWLMMMSQSNRTEFF